MTVPDNCSTDKPTGLDFFFDSAALLKDREPVNRGEGLGVRGYPDRGVG